VVIGAQKSGTTSLYHYLAAHPQIYLPRKELDFFCQIPTGPHVDRYRSAFAGAASDALIGDVSPNYAMFPIFPAVPEQMAAVIPDARLIYVLRHPIERMVAGYLHAVASGLEWRPAFEQLHHGPYFLTSLYGLQLHLFRRFYDDEQILVVTAEDLRDHREATMQRVLEHIGADAERQPLTQIAEEHHPTRGKRVPRAWLRDPRLAGPAVRTAARQPIARRLLTRSITSSDQTVDDTLREQLRLRIQSDLRWLLAQRPELDGWRLLEPAGSAPA
jgi:hypothetical protein